MKLEFPSAEFENAVAAICHDHASDEQVRSINELLRTNPHARDAYLLRLELHSRLASDPDLLTSQDPERTEDIAVRDKINPLLRDAPRQRKPLAWAIALAACLVLAGIGLWRWHTEPLTNQPEATSNAVAMLNQAADAQWHPDGAVPRLNSPLVPGLLRLESGLAQIVFYGGARLVMEGPAELDLISDNEAFCRLGRIVANVPAQARGFRINTPHAGTVELGSSYGLAVTDHQTAVHVFKGALRIHSPFDRSEHDLREGSGALLQRDRQLRTVEADASAFASMFNFEAKSQAAESRRHEQWRTTHKQLSSDPALLLHFDFENVPPSGWQIPNLGNSHRDISDAAIVGCRWTEGRWPEKRALEFQSVNDRVRVAVPGQFQSLTLSAWVCVKGLDRKVNSLFMSDGFESGTVHWLIRRDGVLGLTVIGADPVDHQIVASPPVITLEQFGMWLHLAVVLDAGTQAVIHYLNGVPVHHARLHIDPPFRIGPAELGNWNAKGFPRDDPFMIRNFSGSMDEFLLYNRPLESNEIQSLYTQGKPLGDQARNIRNF